MNIKRLGILLIWASLLVACRTPKSNTKQPSTKNNHHSTQSKSKNTTATATPKNTKTNESTLFFNAEKERLTSPPRQALNAYTEFVNKYPENAVGLFNTARLQFNLGDEQSAVKNVKKACELEPDNKYYRNLYFQLLMYNNKYKDAENQLNFLISKYPENTDYLFKKAMLFVKTKEYENAIEALEQIEQKSGFNEDVILQKKSVYEAMGKTNEAIAQIQKLRNEDPGAIQYIIMMIDTYEKANQKQKSDPLYTELETNFKNEPIAQVALAQYYLGKDHQSQYQYYIEKIVENKNLDPETKISLLIPTIQKLNVDSTKQNINIATLAKKIIEASPESKDAKIFYANVLYYTKQYDEALDEYKKFIRLDESNFEVWNSIISISFDKNEMDSVVNYGKKWIENFPNNPLPYLLTAIGYQQLKNYEPAIKNLDKAADLDSDNRALNSQIYASLGEIYHQQKKYPFSDSCFAKAIELNADDATTLNNYAYYLSLRKVNLKYAETISKKSLKLQPDNKSFLDTYGWILFQLGNYKGAQEYIENALKNSGNEHDATLLEHLGDTYFKLNNKTKAIELWKQALKENEENTLLKRKIHDENWYEE